MSFPMHTPLNVRDVPCTGCSLEARCAEKPVECVAFRTWAQGGNYDNKDVGRLLRPAKKF